MNLVIQSMSKRKEIPQAADRTDPRTLHRARKKQRTAAIEHELPVNIASTIELVCLHGTHTTNTALCSV